MITALLLTTLAPFSPQADWPHFGGPARNSTVPAIESEFEWGEDGPDELWRVPIGPGFGGVAVRDGEVFLLDRDAGEGDILRVFDLDTGEEKWSVGYAAPGRLSFPGSRNVPAVEEDMVYVCGGFGHVAGIDRESHEIVWIHELAEVFGGLEPMFGWSAAPLVVDDMVIVTPLGDEVGLVALDRKTGEEIWITPGVGHSHSTPVVIELLGKQQILFLSTIPKGTGRDVPAMTTISSFEPATGDLLWQTEITLTRLPIPPPIRIDDNRFFLTSGYRGGSTMMQITREGDGYAFEELFHIARGAQVHPALLLDDYLYLIVNENWNDPRARQKEGGLLCLSLDGEEVWRTGDEPYLGRGNVLLAGEHLVIQDGRSGKLRIVPASPDGYQEIAEAPLFDVNERSDHQMWAPMALSDGKLVLRSQDELVCVKP